VIAADEMGRPVPPTWDYTCPNNPLGAKGAGEGGIMSVAGVIANAVVSLLSSVNVQPFELPLSPNRVWAMKGRRAHPLKTGTTPPG
jgi:carbon-monoxide dehydrogenase large subunit